MKVSSIECFVLCLRANDNCFDMVILQVVSPVSDGLEYTRQYMWYQEILMWSLAGGNCSD